MPPASSPPAAARRRRRWRRAMAWAAAGLLLALAALPACRPAPTPTPPPTPPESVAAAFGLLVDAPGAMDGYALFTSRGAAAVYLLDRQGRVAYAWPTPPEYASLRPKLLENGNLLAMLELIPDPAQPSVRQRRIVEIAPDGRLVWQYRRPRLHHDYWKLPNGNVLLLARDIKTREEAIAAGANPQFVGPHGIKLDLLLEVQPTGAYGGRVVWRWSPWEHLVQDFDPAKPNYGVVAEHPELIDLNYNLERIAQDELDEPADWTHINAIGYHPEREQIVLSARNYSELWIIDHSVTAAEAGGADGGNGGRGGDLLYRWGNPRAYGRGTRDGQQLFWHHGAHWIAPGLPGAGNLLLFNNGNEFGGGQRWYSSVDEIAPPAAGYGYRLDGEAAYAPAAPLWSYAADPPEAFYAFFRSRAQRLPNGNTFITHGPHGTFFQVTPQGETVWRYVNPLTVDGAGLRRQDAAAVYGTQETPDGFAAAWNNYLNWAYWYAPDYPGLQGLDLAADGPRLELPAP